MIYFAFQGAADEYRSSGISALAPRADFVEYGGMTFGVIYQTRWQDRGRLNDALEQFLAMPGPAIGTLTKAQAQHISAAFPNAKEGDAFSAVLHTIYAATSHEAFNPNHH